MGGVKFLLPLETQAMRIWSRGMASGAGREGVKPSMGSRRMEAARGVVTRGPTRDTTELRVFRLEVRELGVWSQDWRRMRSTGVMKDTS